MSTQERVLEDYIYVKNLLLKDFGAPVKRTRLPGEDVVGLERADHGGGRGLKEERDLTQKRRNAPPSPRWIKTSKYMM